MSRGQDTSRHAGRQVGPHLAHQWRPTNPADIHSGPLGELTSHAMTPGMSLAAWEGSGGHLAEVSHDAAFGSRYQGMESNRYVAGPFRTPLRAQVAAESLANRVESGVGHDQYRRY